MTVSLPYEEYKHVKSYEVNLSVVANLIILPGEVYMMMGDVIKFKIIYVSNNHLFIYLINQYFNYVQILCLIDALSTILLVLTNYR